MRNWKIAVIFTLFMIIMTFKNAQAGEYIRINGEEFTRDNLFNVEHLIIECEEKNRQMMNAVKNQDEWESRDEYLKRKNNAEALLTDCGRLDFPNYNTIEYGVWGTAKVEKDPGDNKRIWITFPGRTLLGPFIYQHDLMYIHVKNVNTKYILITSKWETAKIHISKWAKPNEMEHNFMFYTISFDASRAVKRMENDLAIRWTSGKHAEIYLNKPYLNFKQAIPGVREIQISANCELDLFNRVTGESIAKFEFSLR